MTKNLSSSEQLGNVVMELTQAFVDQMTPGTENRSKMTEIVDSVAKQTGVSASKIRPFVTMYLKNSPMVEVKKGRTGGVIRLGNVASTTTPTVVASLVEDADDATGTES